MTINLKKPDITELKPRITVFGVGGGGQALACVILSCGHGHEIVTVVRLVSLDG